MQENKLFRPAAYAIRKPTETSKEHGRVLNPPRMSEIGGMDKLHEKYGKKVNNLKLRKPGGTI
jgi:hypothetical protein